VRRQRRVRGTRRRTDWIPFIDFRSEAVLLQHFALVDTTDLVDKDGFLTVERTVGETIVVPTDSAGDPVVATIWEGIILSEVDNTGGITNWQPRNAIDADAPWLWRRVTVNGVTQAGSAIGQVNDFAGSHLDVHVRRKMNERQDLLYCVELTGAPYTGVTAAAGFNLIVNLRTLVKLA